MKNQIFVLGATFCAAFCIAISGCSSNVAPTTIAPVAPVVAAPVKTPSTIVAPVATTNPKTKSPIAAKKTVALKPIVWRSDYEAALKEAAQARKPVMVDFYTDWCGACKMMDAEAYTDASVIDTSRSFVMVKVDAEKRTDLAQKFKVDGYPTILWMDADEKVLDSSPGYGGVEMLQNSMKNALANFAPTV